MERIAEVWAPFIWTVIGLAAVVVVTAAGFLIALAISLFKDRNDLR